jgi:mono/diheme cytochrome c family protein
LIKFVIYNKEKSLKITIMKKSILSVMVVIAAAFAVMAFTLPTFKNINPPQDKPVALFPADVQKIFETSCYDCHSDAASNAKAKMKLNFSKWGELTDAKKVGKMENINEVVSKGDMPPGKYVTNNPDRALGQEQKDLVNKWVTAESAKLMGE